MKDRDEDITSRTRLSEDAHLIGLANQVAIKKMWKLMAVICGAVAAVFGAGIAVPAYIEKVAHTEQQAALATDMATMKSDVSAMKVNVQLLLDTVLHREPRLTIDKAKAVP